MQCNKCRKEAVIYQPYSGQHLCKQHFVADVEAKAKRAIRKHHWLRPGDHIAVALSGNRQSSAVLYFLKKLTAERRDIHITAITIDKGIAGHNNTVKAMQIAESLGIPCVCGSFQEEFGITIDGIAMNKGDDHSCSYCRVLKRTLLNRIAGRNGFAKLALGFSLDDGAQSVLANVLRGDVERLIRPEGEISGTIPWISPFISVPTAEAALYADLHGMGVDQSTCPHDHDTFHKAVNKMLEDYTCRHPATKFALMNLGENLTRAGVSSAMFIQTCDLCKEPCEGIFGNCRILEEVTIHAA